MSCTVVVVQSPLLPAVAHIDLSGKVPSPSIKAMRRIAIERAFDQAGVPVPRREPHTCIITR